MAEHSGKTITFGTDLLPLDDDTYFLGNENKRWKDIYATNLYGNASSATVVGKGTHTAAVTANEFSSILSAGTMTIVGNVSNTSMPKTNNANAELIIKTHPTSESNYYEARLGFSSNGALYYMPVNATTWQRIAYQTALNDYLPLTGGNMTGQIKTSFKSSIAMGSYGSAQATIPNLLEEVRYSSGCAGSFNLTTAYTLNNVTLATGWYNFMYIPHRSGGMNGTASGDNCNYGVLYLHRMNATGYADYVLSYAGESAKLLDLHASFQSTVTDAEIVVADGTLGHIKTSGYKVSSFAPSSTISCTTENVKTALSITSSGSTTKWLNQQGSWVTIAPADIGAATSTHTHDYAASNHTHGNITNDGKMFDTTVSSSDAVTTAHKFLREDGSWVVPKYTTNAVTHLYVNATAGGATSNATTINTTTYMHLYDDSAKRATIQFKGSGSTTVTATGGVITISSTDNNNAVTHTPSQITKYYLTGTSSSTATTSGDTYDIDLYTTQTAGELSALRYSLHYGSVEKAHLIYNNTDDSIDFVFV